MNSAEPTLPLVVQLGFAGSRQLLDTAANPTVREAEFLSKIQSHLITRLKQLHGDLRLSPKHFFCGISQVAVGADTLFTRACRELNWPQFIFLPQQREDFLNAKGSSGTPDFTDEQRAMARDLLASPHVVQERLVSDSPNRHTRFEDVNLEIVRISDVIVCLVRSDSSGKPGGTRELIADADRRKRTLLEIRVSIDPEGGPVFEETWHHRDTFAPVLVPDELADLRTDLAGIPTAAEYYKPLKVFASAAAKWKQTLFKIAALVIIGTHVIATACAVIALKTHGGSALPWLLGGELLLLALGFSTHQYLHRSHAATVWAMARLVAEIARSGIALREVAGYPSHLFNLPLPDSLQRLLRTLNVLHLRETRTLTVASWQDRRNRYVENRLTKPKGGQIPYYEQKLKSAEPLYAVARWAFLIASVCAFVATLGKLLLICNCLPVPEAHHDASAAVLGTLAIVLPVIAVAALSLAASFDLEGRVHTYREMLLFLQKQKEHLENATSGRAFSTLAFEAEARLLGETASWYSRRAFIGVT